MRPTVTTFVFFLTAFTVNQLWAGKGVWAASPLWLPSPLPLLPFYTPCTDTCTFFPSVMFHRASMLPAAAMAQQH